MEIKNFKERAIVAFIIGFSLEFILSNFWGYSKPVLTVLGVPLFIVLLWTALLPVAYQLRDMIFKKKTLIKDLIFSIITLNIIEYIGGSVLFLRLSVADQYPALLTFDAWKAPLWLLFVYMAIALGYFKLIDNREKKK
jgi:hypothetical protein